ncbi:XRE family transcriptional regulator [Mycobacterium sp. PS03-16]|uniref:helix-turn-helix transcriptional regulator n=1 Tax=Mycobacterium sp. PS03-16 TaxID=2559611 RepID=UPI0010737D40|nr:helix-turn-helix transcriptional regulator [Mycobacterium sp. PS03-16]TFV57814.1 XRE family transcriptional regulator [Mycobacterium sp. PS03-16]
MDQRPMARFLRDRRARLRPSDVDLPSDGPRRTAGLRREEVAALAHISASYYTRLEQARASRPSSEVLSSVSQALKLSDDERTLLFTLSGRSPEEDNAQTRRDVAPSVIDLIDRMPDTAALILDAKYDILAWNSLATAVFGDLSAIPGRQRNLVRSFFLEPDPARRHHGVSGSEDFARFAVSQLRAVTERYPRDRDLQALIAELRGTSPRFDSLWHGVDVVVPRHQIKSMTHAVVGPIDLHCDLLSIPDRDQLMILFTADAGTPSHDALSRLSRYASSPTCR